MRRLAIALGVVFLTAISAVVLGRAANAGGQDRVVSALEDYVRVIEAGSKPAIHPNSNANKPAAKDSADVTYAALRVYAHQISADQPKSTAALPKFAEADSLVDFLRGLNSPAKPSASPKAPSTGNGPVAGGTQSKPPVDATVVGTKVCVTCHAASTDQFSHTLMGRLAKTQKGKFECESCHGPGSAHVNAGGGRGVGGIISFRPEDRSRTAEENNAICLGCHERGDRTYWSGSTHETRGLMCTNCHTVMKQVSRKFQLTTAFEPDGCYQCHKDRRAENYFSSHMPVGQGKITCTDCHNPHGSATEALLRENSVNDNCYKCHAEKRGPFLWEHNPVRENCLNCHEAHGSTKQAMLKVQSPKLCAECHGFDHGTNLLGPSSSRFIFNKGCMNCHSKVHGSNHPSGMFFLR